MPSDMTTKFADSNAIAEAAAHLREGALVAFATETVYGLGADATNSKAIAEIFATKGRPRFNPLIVHVPDLEMAKNYGVFNATAAKLAGRFWPGALTLVVPKRVGSGLADLVTAGLESVALRSPDHPHAQALLRAAKRPLAAPSANRSGAVSPTTAEHVARDLGDTIAMVLDSGPTPLGLESTVLGVDGEDAVLLRPGALAREEIERFLGTPLKTAPPNGKTNTPTAPGQLASHYAPRAAVRLNATDVQTGEALLAFGPHVPPCDGPHYNLSPTGDVTEAAVHLFAALRALDQNGVTTIAVMPIPETGLGEAINDRLARAAAPRS